METSISINRNIRRLYRLSQKYAMAQMRHPELTPAELKLLRHIGFHGEVLKRRQGHDLQNPSEAGADGLLNPERG